MPADFSGQNLRGRSFKGQNLAGANFNGADIRGADFSWANLTDANFTNVHAGVSQKWIISVGLLLLSLVLSALSPSLIVAVLVTIFIIICLTISTFKYNYTTNGRILTITSALAILGSVALVLAVVLYLVITQIASVSVVIAGLPPVVVGIVGLVYVVLVGSESGILSTANNDIGGFISLSKAIINELIKNTITNTGGTSFHAANLTNADFQNASLKYTNFGKANVTYTKWFQARNLDRARVGMTYLQNSKVRKLLITRQGKNKNFDGFNLRSVNLQRANLTDASFIGADLSKANLQDADLSRVKLKQTQLDGTDFTGATLTGAFIEDWNISTDTKFDGVRCEYVYMHLPTQDSPDPHRKPDNREEVFADGEFGDFIKPIFDTLDLYHSQGVDPRAIAISFKQLAENNPDVELEIVAMEKRGQDKFLLRAKTAITADKSQLSAEYFATYNQLKALAEQEVKALIAEKDGRIADLQNMVVTALQRHSFYSNVEQVGFMSNNPGGFSVGGSVGGTINNVQGDNNRAVQGDNNQAVLGDSNQVTQQNQVGADTAQLLTKEDVVKLLAQLETLIKGAELPANTKEEIVEDLSAAKKATDKEDPNKQRALERLTGVAETLEKTSKSVEAGQKIWITAKPIIIKVASWLGAGAGSHLLGL